MGGTGWRRAFCNNTATSDRKQSIETETVKTADKHQQQSSSSPRLCKTNPNTPRLRCNTSSDSNHHRKNIHFSAIYSLVSPKLQCKTTPKSQSKSPTPTSVVGYPRPSSPRSPFSILKNSLRPPKVSVFAYVFNGPFLIFNDNSVELQQLMQKSCGACTQSLKTGQRTAIYTAECSHSFHFPCIATHLKKQSSLTCPVCNTTWKNSPILFNGIHYSEIQDDRVNIKSSISPRFYQSRMFADDEPLATPKFLDRITESADKDSIVEEEFQRFLPHVDAISDHPSENVEISMSPQTAALISPTTYAFVLKIRAPPPLHSRRAPINLVAVLDTSPTMSGPKLQMLQRAMRLVISSLGLWDRLSLISFSDEPKRLMPLTIMTRHGQRLARRAIDRLDLGCTDGSSTARALKLASVVLEDRREKNSVATIILLSDKSHQELDDRDRPDNRRLGSCHLSSTRFSDVEIPVRPKEGEGEGSEDDFLKCVGGLLSVVVQDLKISLNLARGSDPGEISAVYSSTNGRRPMTHDANCVGLGNLYAEEERELLVEIRTPEDEFALHHHHHVLSIRCSYRDPSTKELVCGPERTNVVPKPWKNERLKSAFVAIRAVAEGRRLVENKEVDRAVRILGSARGLLMQSRFEFAEDCLRMVEAELAEIDWTRKSLRWQCGGGGNNRVVGYVRRGFDHVGDLHGFENARF